MRKERGTMKKILITMFMAALFVCLAIPTQAARKVYIIGNGVRVRTGPGTEYRVVGSVYKGDMLTYRNRSKLDDNGGRWFNVTYEGKSRWVSTKYANLTKKEKTSSKTKVITTGNVWLRKGPGTKYAEYRAVGKGSRLTYKNKSAFDNRGVKWYKVSYNGKKLWVSSKYSYLESSAGGKKVYMLGDEYVRKSYNKNSASLGVAKKGTYLTYLKDTEEDSRGIDWYKVSYKGKKGWVSSLYADIK